MPTPFRLALVLALQGCLLVSPDALDERLDQDGDGVDGGSDCDDLDPAVGAASTWFGDADQDGYGAGDGAASCVAPEGAVASDGDCDDAESTVHPGAAELCNAVDDDCSGAADEGAGASWTLDGDDDGYGDANATPIVACDRPGDAYTTSSGDCDDADPLVFPRAPVACTSDDRNCDGVVDDLDGDGDGFAGCEECDDADAGTNPDADETCDGSDEDCDGDIDDEATDATRGYADVDEDGYGDAAVFILDCDALPVGYVADGEDCDDTRFDVSPGAEERCNGLDDDCDGEVNESPVDGATWYADTDGDGFGDDASAVVACAAPGVGYVALGADCDDEDVAQYPGAVEDCALLVDLNCDGSSGTSDLDEDGWVACGECNDKDADIFPGAVETCNGRDDDCDGQFDEVGATGAPTWYEDADGDGFGSATASLAACVAPAGYVPDGTDCDDASSAHNPSAVEQCDGIDDDCDGVIDDDPAVAPLWYRDADDDGAGDPLATKSACVAPSGYVATDDDCDDSTPDRGPTAIELCNSLDDDCDRLVDEDGSAGAPAWHPDLDADGFGDEDVSVFACLAPNGLIADDSDCDDARKAVNPSGKEVCDAADADEDCDGLADDADSSASGRTPWYLDADADGAGSVSSTLACDAPASHVATDDDCDDTRGDVSPTSPEVCDPADVDEDCDGTVDDADATVTGLLTWYADLDKDGFYGTTATLDACQQPPGHSPTASDCDDANAAIGAAGVEVCDGSNTDEDCDGKADDADPSATGQTPWYLDADSDGAAGPTSTSACDAPPAHLATSTDCDDARADVSPSAVEVCDAANIDEDCDGKADDADASATKRSTWYTDADGDTYGSLSTVLACDAAAGRVATSTDCDDTKALVNPAATEVCNTVDDDCDKSVDEGVTTAYYRDSDADLFGDPLQTLPGCAAPIGYVANKSDCDDTSSLINPSGSELCNGADDDCDTVVDEGVKNTYYRDVDGDDHGVTSPTASACSAPVGFAAASDDCNDAAPAIYPTATELCNTLDDDCDTLVDEGACSAICPVYAKAGLATNGDGSLASPFRSINDAIALRGSCLQINVLPGTYAEQVRYNGLSLEIVSTGGAAVTTIDPVSGAGVVFDNKESSAALLQGFTLTGGTGQLGDGVDLLASTRYGGGIYVRRAGPTLLDNIIEANTGAQRGGGVSLCGFTGVFSGNVVRNNTATGDGGGLYTACNSTGSVDGNTLTGNRATGGGTTGGGIYVFTGSMTFSHNWIEANTSGASGVSGDGLYLRQSTSRITNNVLSDHTGEALSLASKDQSVVANNTCDGNTVGLDVQDNAQATPRILDNLFTGGGTGVSMSDKTMSSLLGFGDNDVFGNTTAYGGGAASQTGKGGNVAVDPQYVDSVAEDFHLRVTSPVADDGQNTAPYGVTDDYDGVARPLGAAYAIGAFER